MRHLVAVSGGVDSVALLDMMAKAGYHEIIVAHFDHGIRDNSADDAQFVAALAGKYGFPFETKREVLGADASEELARDRRYIFLRDIAKKHNATLVTAHHMDDIAETIAINIARGTGWRGVAVLAGDIYRPLLDKTKQDLLLYAKENNLEWREDSTNASDTYLRNRLRRKMTDEDVVLQLSALRARQIELRDAIDEEIANFIDGQKKFSRYFFTQIPHQVALEMLRGIGISRIGQSPTRPQLDRALLAIKTARAGTKFPFGDAQLMIDKTDFGLSVKTP